MIELSADFDLGQDRTRIKDPRDGVRQAKTARTILARFFGRDPEHRAELQVLADEVGMGKTFVALAVAYSVLSHLRTRPAPDGLTDCSKRVVIITPQNSALFRKWRREVAEFVGRCVLPEHQAAARAWFAPVAAERLDELVAALRKKGPRVIVTTMGALGSARLQQYDLKRRVLLGALFRHWGKRFPVDARERLLKGAPPTWPRDPYALTAMDARDAELALFDEDQMLKAVRRLERFEGEDGCIEKLLERCREIATPYVRGRDELFADVEVRLVDVYRKAITRLGKRAIPLVIVDEAHNWKNGPSLGTNGYWRFREVLARRTRRILLLSATPFQLRPDEMVELLRISDDIQPAATEEGSKARRENLRVVREDVVRQTLKRASERSRHFATEWSRLPRGVGTDVLDAAWGSAPVAAARVRLHGLAKAPGLLDAGAVEMVVDTAVASVSPDSRALVRHALHLYAHNADLSAELGRMVIRHRRATDHRLVRVGEEVVGDLATVQARPDRHTLHAAAGLDVRGDAELPHYLLMRCVSEMKRGKGRSSLGSDLTGCWSTLLHSAEGRKIREFRAESKDGGLYLNLLLDLVDPSHDPEHPKLATVVENVLRAWQAGEKTLLFCFRTNTADRLRTIIDQRIRQELLARRQRCLGGEESLRSLRTRLTGRDRDLVSLGLDRLLWSFYWASRSGEIGGGGMWSPCPYAPEDLRFAPESMPELARLFLAYGVDAHGERLDRVFLHRAHELIAARRLLRRGNLADVWKRLLSAVADEAWLIGPYGQVARDEKEDEGEERSGFEERGVQTAYERGPEPSQAQVQLLSEELTARHVRAGARSVFDVYAQAPSLFLGSDPVRLAARAISGGEGRAVCRIHDHLAELAMCDGEIDWEGRRVSFQALRRALLRESVLLRLLPDRTELEEASWGELLARTFFAPLPGQSESMADRIEVFLEDVRAASGSHLEPGSPRHTVLEATRLRDQQFVAVVKGGGDPATRERVFAGFNSPLLPEVLICTSVGQEGIDLHRHCDRVVHYDLAWNPAVIEQRTGRVDRIGSKTFRERAVSPAPEAVFLEVDIPFLAGTYDERMWEELRLRAQTFEVLTGGEVAIDDVVGCDDEKGAEGREGALRFTPLPATMVEDMRVKLHVYVQGSAE